VLTHPYASGAEFSSFSRLTAADDRFNRSQGGRDGTATTATDRGLVGTALSDINTSSNSDCCAPTILWRVPAREKLAPVMSTQAFIQAVQAAVAGRHEADRMTRSGSTSRGGIYLGAAVQGWADARSFFRDVSCGPEGQAVVFLTEGLVVAEPLR